LHRTVAEFLDWMLLPPTVWTTFPAGWGKLGKAVAGRLKACGMKEGMPDAFVFHGGRAIGIEFKTETSKQSLVQINMNYKLMNAGIPVYVCRSIEEVYDILISHKVPMRSFNGILPTSESRRPPQLDARTSAP
jgi:hypothetical protein